MFYSIIFNNMSVGRIIKLEVGQIGRVIDFAI